MRAALAIGCVAVLCVVTVTAQRPRPATAAESLPDLSMTCPNHPEVVEARPGTCPICQTALVPVRLDSSWMCPIHAAVMESEAGTCRICRRDLIRVTVALTWTCRGDASEHLEPGVCKNGSPRIGRRTLRPHGNHNPQHGGQFFMAPDNWHHLEGTYPAERVFRLYVYDDYARPVPAAELRRAAGRVVTEETYDPATRETKDLRAFPLRASRDGAYLEARVDPAALPRDVTAKIRLRDGGPEYRFDFTFTEVTRAPIAPSATSSRARATAAASGRASSPTGGGAPSVTPPRETTTVPSADPTVTPAPEETVAAGDPALTVLPIPDAMEEMLAQLRRRLGHVGELIERGNLEAVYVPAFQAKDLVVALEPHLAHLPGAKRDVAGPALERVVRLAWLLDAFGDTGNRQQVSAAYAAFSAAVQDVLAAFEEEP